MQIALFLPIPHNPHYLLQDSSVKKDRNNFSVENTT